MTVSLAPRIARRRTAAERDPGTTATVRLPLPTARLRQA